MPKAGYMFCPATDAHANGEAPVAELVEAAEGLGKLHRIAQGGHHDGHTEAYLGGEGCYVAELGEGFERGVVAGDVFLGPEAFVAKLLGPGNELTDEVHIGWAFLEELGHGYADGDTSCGGHS